MKETIIGRHTENGKTFSWILPAKKKEKFFLAKKLAKNSDQSVLALVENGEGFSTVEVVDHGMVLKGDHTVHKKAVFFYVGDPCGHIPNFREISSEETGEKTELQRAERKVCFEYLQSLGRRADALACELREWNWTKAFDILFQRENDHPVNRNVESLWFGTLPFVDSGAEQEDDEVEVVCGLPGIPIEVRTKLLEKVGRAFFENLSRAVFAQQKLERVISKFMRDYSFLDSAWNSWSIGIRDRKFRIVATKFSDNEPLQEIDGSFISSFFCEEEKKKIEEFISYADYFARHRFLWIDFVKSLSPEQKEWHDQKMAIYEGRKCWPPRPRNIRWGEE